MQDIVLQADALTINREGQPVLRDVSFAMAPGRITGLIGPSGSGKTTLMRAVVGAQRIAAGRLTVLGLSAGSKALRPRIGYVTQSPAVYDDLTARQNIQYFATILRLPRAAVDEVIGVVDLQPQANQVVGSLSGGQKARVSLAVALLGNAQLLVLDEPTVGLDPLLRQKLWALFARLADEGRSLIISSHVMEEAELCNDLLLLRDGRLLAYGPKAQLLHDTQTKSVEAAFLKLVKGVTRAR